MESIDVMVEDNDTVFLAYPLSDAAREWFDMNMSRNTQRLGNIQFVEPCPASRAGARTLGAQTRRSRPSLPGPGKRKFRKSLSDDALRSGGV